MTKLDATNPICHSAALYVLGILPDEEKRAFEGHLRAGCVVCAAALRDLERVAGDLGLAAAPANPPAHLRQRLMDEIAGEKRAAGKAKRAVLLDEAGLLISRSANMPWEQAAPGILSKMLFMNPARRYMTALMRMEPGTHYPSHRHKEVEELFLLQGDLHVQGQVMRPGDYCRAEPETIHGEIFTESGCMFLVLASQQDEILGASGSAPVPA